MTRPLVTVLIDTYNHERFIEQAIESVLRQDFPRQDTEVMVVDDGSTDATPELVQKFAPRARLLRKANGGQASAFNAAIPEARGEIIAFLDGDDWWEPRKLVRVVETMQANPDAGLVGHAVTEVYANGKHYTESLRETSRLRLNSLAGARLFRVRRNFLGTSRMTLRAAVLKQVLPVPEALRFEADEYITAVAAVFADVLILPEALTFYRLHDANQFLLTAADHEGLRRKQQVLAALAAALRSKLLQIGLAEEIFRLLTDLIQAEADQLRLTLDGGLPWETAKTELALYRALHEGAPLAHRIFKYATLAPALFLPPRLFYGARRRITQNSSYLRARKKWLPVPQPEHVARSWKTGS